MTKVYLCKIKCTKCAPSLILFCINLINEILFKNFKKMDFRSSERKKNGRKKLKLKIKC